MTHSSSSSEYGNYIVLNGKRLSLKKHPTDFSIIGHSEALKTQTYQKTTSISTNMTRVITAGVAEVNGLMTEARQDSVAHHIYQIEGTDEEIIIDDRIILKLRYQGTGVLEKIIEEFCLHPEGRMGEAYVLRLTSATGRNPIKIANEIAERDDIVYCTPEVMLEIQFHQQPALFPEQWYLTADLISNLDVMADSDIQSPEAWEITTGNPEIVVAVIDDGFDLQHPAFSNTRIHPERRDFEGQDREPLAEDRIIGNRNFGDYHGTPVASIAVGSHSENSSMRGIAPNCTFMPVRIGFGRMARPIDILEVFRYVSARADVVNCSFGTSPSSFDPMPADFRSEITRLTETGGRRGKGLVMVFSAANDDAPTFLAGNENINGVKFTSGNSLSEIPAGRSVFSGYPMTEGVIVVASMSSLKRKSGYSCWGPHITVTAPSNNSHYIMDFIAPGTPGRAQFVTNYRGLGQVAAINRPGHGAPFSPILRFDNPATPDLKENFYTKDFGGTSGAAPVVTGIVGLMLSVNPELSALQVKQILMSTADKDLDPILDLTNDPNIQGLSGEFINGHSLFFGSGKVNAFKAVSRARALAGGGNGTVIREHFGEVHPSLLIPDNKPEGIFSDINIEGFGSLKHVSVTLDITHSWRGDLIVTLIAPSGLGAQLHHFSGGSADDIKQTYSSDNSLNLELLVRAGVEVHGRWRLHVSDHVMRDVGTLNSWSLHLRS